MSLKFSYHTLILLLFTVFIPLFILTMTACSGSVSDTAPSQSAPPPSSSQPPPKPSTASPPLKVPTVPFRADGIATPGEYAGLNKYGDFSIEWSADQEYIYIYVKAKTTGFVGIGFQGGSRMLNADIVIGYVHDGKITIEDAFSTGSNGPHPSDKELGGTNDILEFAGIEKDGFTSIEFKRKLITGDKYDVPMNKGVNIIIWAFGSADSLQMQHVVRGYGEINL